MPCEQAEAKGAQELRDAIFGFLPGNAVNAGGELEMLFDGEVVEEAEVFGQHADAALELDGVVTRIESAHFNFAGGGRQQTGEHLDGGGLSGAVRT